MTLKEIMDKCNNLSVEQHRTNTDDYIELVFYTKDTEQWGKALGGLLGLPAKPVGADPSEGDQILTRGYGGIHKNQTLFKNSFDENGVIAMFWPWQDGTHTTLKLILFKRES